MNRDPLLVEHLWTVDCSKRRRRFSDADRFIEDMKRCAVGGVSFTNDPTRFGGSAQLTFAGKMVAETEFRPGESPADVYDRLLAMHNADESVPFTASDPPPDTANRR